MPFVETMDATEYRHIPDPEYISHVTLRRYAKRHAVPWTFQITSLTRPTETVRLDLTDSEAERFIAWLRSHSVNVADQEE